MSEDIEHIGDHISNLPDCILHHILSFMPTIEVVKTSILSTSWKNLWASVPNIDLNDSSLHPPKVTSFMNFVEKVLHSRGALNLEKFKLTSYGYSTSSLLNSWISDAITHNIQELDLRSFAENPSIIPWYMLDNTSLATLKISMHCVVKLPSHISFPCLKTLELFSVTFLNGDSVQMFLSGCPVLEELVLLCCQCKNQRFIVISSSSLKRLSIHEPLDLYFRSININAANLICFEYSGNISNKILLNNASSSLVDVHIDIDTPQKRKKKVACRVVDLVKDVRFTVSLWVSNWIIESLKCADNMAVLFPVFPNLIHLTLTRKTKNHTFGALMDFLSSCPVLQSICFSKGFMCLGENNSIWSSIPICISNCLKIVTLRKFHGYNTEICFLKCVFKYARVLERMDITYVGDLKRKMKVMKELEKIERSSTDCVINFS